MKRIQFFSLLCLLIALPINAVTADMNVIWVRAGAMLETEHKHNGEPKINIATMSNGTAHELADPPTIQWLDAKRVLLQFAWQPNQHYRFRLDDAVIAETAPLKPMPYLIRTVELDGLLSLLENLRQPAKPTAITLGHGKAANAEKLAIATDTGHLAILHPLTGKTLWNTRISEGYVKHIAFNHDNTILYIGEQAADGFIYAYDLSKPALLWKYRTAADIETSTPSDPESVYAWVNYPGAACIRALPNGALLVASVHSWTHNGKPQRKSQLYRFNGKTGAVVWKWPSEGPLQKVLRWFDISADGKTLALLTDNSGKGNGRLSVLDVESGKEQWHASFEPLKPYFEGVSFWRGVSMTPDGRFINVTTDDGRAFIFDATRPTPKLIGVFTHPMAHHARVPNGGSRHTGILGKHRRGTAHKRNQTNQLSHSHLSRTMRPRRTQGSEETARLQFSDQTPEIQRRRRVFR